MKEKTKLTEKEITILKGRQAEGYSKVNRFEDNGTLFFVEPGWGDCISTSKTDRELFLFIKNGEEHSIDELLKE